MKYLLIWSRTVCSSGHVFLSLGTNIGTYRRIPAGCLGTALAWSRGSHGFKLFKWYNYHIIMGWYTLKRASYYPYHIFFSCYLLISNNCVQSLKSFRFIYAVSHLNIDLDSERVGHVSCLIGYLSKMIYIKNFMLKSTNQA